MKIIFKPTSFLNATMVVLMFFTFFLLSCNSEEYYVSEQELVEEEIIVEEEEEEEKDLPEDNTNDMVLVSDSFTTIENTPINLDLFVNDEEVISEAIITFTGSVGGIINIDNNNTPGNVLDDVIEYVPNINFVGNDNFEYEICDLESGEVCETASVSMDVVAKDPDFEDDVSGELKAFPTAFGDGAYTTGGRGGVVVHVTNLNDSGSGSLREALQMSVPRIIVFDVSGVIKLNSHLGIGSSNGNVTIAGQTAPKGGITIDGGRLYIYSAENVIVRYIRFKGGYADDNDSVTVTGNIINHIWDHCSFSYGTDEGASWYSGTGKGTDQNKITVQRCMWNENLKGSILGKYSGNGGTPASGSYISNLFYNTGYRFPNLAGDDGARFDVINNVIWNVTNRLIRGDGSFELNHIGNYYNYGTRGLVDKRTNLISHGGVTKIYNFNNKIVAKSESNPLTYSVAEMNADGDKSWGYFQDGNGHNYGDRLPEEYFTSQQHSILGPNFNPLTGDAAFDNVVNNVGCNARLNGDGSVSVNLDGMDENALNQIFNGAHVERLNKTSYSVSSIASVKRAVDYDTDFDGMPDEWEILNGYDPNIDDSVGDRDGDGYTNIEEFLNRVDY